MKVIFAIILAALLFSGCRETCLRTCVVVRQSTSGWDGHWAYARDVETREIYRRNTYLGEPGDTVAVFVPCKGE